LAVFLALGAAVLLARRLAGALGAPLDTATLLATALALAAVVAGARLTLRLPAHWPGAPGRRWLVPGILSLAVLSAGVGLSLPGTSPAGLAALWAALIAEELWAWRPAAWGPLRISLPRRRDRARTPRADAPRPPAPDAVPVPPVNAAEPPAEAVTQQLTRAHTPDGGESLAGWLRVPFAGGQRVANVHVAFCPPFGRTPGAKLEQLEGPAARIKTGQVLACGARFDLKLSGPAEEPAVVLLRFTAEARPTAEAESP
jgi:hypothetical protein